MNRETHTYRYPPGRHVDRWILRQSYTHRCLQALYCVVLIYLMCGSFPDCKLHKEIGKKGPDPGPTLQAATLHPALLLDYKPCTRDPITSYLEPFGQTLPMIWAPLGLKDDQGAVICGVHACIQTHVRSNTCMQGSFKIRDRARKGREAGAILSVLLSSSTQLGGAENSKSNPAFWVIRLCSLAVCCFGLITFKYLDMKIQAFGCTLALCLANVRSCPGHLFKFPLQATVGPVTERAL